MRSGGDLSTSTGSRSSYNSRQIVHKSPYAYNEDDNNASSKRRQSESGGESDGRHSLDLASSHTSDDDETVTNRSLSLSRNSKGRLIHFLNPY